MRISAMGYQAFMGGNGDVEGDYTLVAFNPAKPGAPRENQRAEGPT